MKFFDFLKRKKTGATSSRPNREPLRGGGDSGLAERPKPPREAMFSPSKPAKPPITEAQELNRFKAWGFFCLVILPSIAIVYSNYQVLPGALEVATIIVIMIAGIGTALTVTARRATPKVKKRVVNAHILVMFALLINLSIHFILSREIAAANEATAERHVEEDRQEAREEAASKRRVNEMNAAKDLEKIASDRYANQGWAYSQGRRLGMSGAGQRFKDAGTQLRGLPDAISQGGQVAQQTWGLTKTKDQVLAIFIPLLILSALLDMFAAFGGYGWVLRGWEWDRNGNGIDDRLERPAAQPSQAATIPPAYTGTMSPPTGRANGLDPEPIGGPSIPIVRRLDP